MDLSKLYTQRKTLNPTEAFLARMLESKTPPPLVIPKLAALHTGLGETDKPLRTGPLAHVDVALPPAHEVEKLVGLLLGRLLDNLREATQPGDDYLVAAFAAYGITAIRPFDDGNGRTALDLAQYLLMWQRQQPILALCTTSHSHHEFARLFETLNVPGEASNAAVSVAARQALVTLIDRANMAYLRGNSVFRKAAHWLSSLASGH